MTKNKKTLFILVFSFVFLNAQDLFGWGRKGHCTVANIAYRYLSREARTNLKKVLPYGLYIDKAVYPDNVKSDSTGKFDKYSVWHFVDVQEDDLSFEKFKELISNEEKPNAYKAILTCVEELKKNPNNIFYLSYLIHIIGDVHQPLHVGRPSDRGGNRIKVKWEGRKKNLHQVWDSGLIEVLNYSFSELSAVVVGSEFRRNKKLRKNYYFTDDDVARWIYGTYLRRAKVYDSVYMISPKSKNGGFRYSYYYTPLLYESLYAGGVHLATVLESLYGN